MTTGALIATAPLSKDEVRRYSCHLIMPGIYDPSLADDNLEVGTEETYAMARRLAREEGLLVGISSAAAAARWSRFFRTAAIGTSAKGFGVQVNSRGCLPRTRRESSIGNVLRREAVLAIFPPIAGGSRLRMTRRQAWRFPVMRGSQLLRQGILGLVPRGEISERSDRPVGQVRLI